MPQLSRAQLIELSRVPGTRFFIWHEGPASRFYHLMIAPDGLCVAWRVGWEQHASSTTPGPLEIERRYARSASWVQVTRDQFCAVMEGRYNAPSGKHDPQLKTNHKLGAPKGKLP